MNTFKIQPDMKLEEFATKSQWNYYILYCEHGGYRPAEKVSGIEESKIRKSVKYLLEKASIQGYAPECNMTRTVPNTHTATGVSSYYDENGKLKGQWVKSNLKKEAEAEMMKAFIEGLVSNIEPIEEIRERKGSSCGYDTDRLCSIPLPDMHMGLLCDRLTVGEGWDVKTSLNMYKTGIVELIKSCPKTETVILTNLGDLAHQNDSSNSTPTSHNALDVDGRVEKTIYACAVFLSFTIELLLKKFKYVDIRNILGNHSPDIEMGINVALKMRYENNPRVKLPEVCQIRDYLVFGRNLLGFTHKPTGKPESLAGLMAIECQKLWSQVDYRYFLHAHTHKGGRIEVNGVVIESMRTLIPRDNFAFTGGWYSGRQLDAIIYHKEFGECGRRIVGAKKVKNIIKNKK